VKFIPEHIDLNPREIKRVAAESYVVYGIMSVRGEVSFAANSQGRFESELTDDERQAVLALVGRIVDRVEREAREEQPAP